MRNQFVWSQWPDLKTPPGFSILSDNLTNASEEYLKQIDVYVPRYLGTHANLRPIGKLPNVHFVQLPMAGFDAALPYMRKGMKLSNAAGVHNDSTAELALALTLASLRGFPKFIRDQQIGKWDHTREQSLSDKTVGIIGYGSIGKSLEKLLSNFPVTIRRFALSSRENVISISNLDLHLPDLDVIILLIPLSNSSQHMFNEGRFAKMKPGALLVNVARGPIVDSEALLDALKSGRIHAALDVTDPEPLPDSHPLWKEPNCFIVPHVGGDSSAFEPRARRLVEEQLCRLYQGLEPMHLIDWESLRG
jgi:phosphoglycerate dehydrogenase-like enzyme